MQPQLLETRLVLSRLLPALMLLLRLSLGVFRLQQQLLQPQLLETRQMLQPQLSQLQLMQP
jgi:hypothetical protein